uniref:DMT family transporter n=1 Tax=Trebonia sp. TaxID=2767075 RepID=UPI0026091ECC
MSSSLIAIAAAVVSALFLGIASVADQRSTKRVETTRSLSPRIFVELIRQPLWLLAIVANIVGFALQIVALSFGSLALVQPLLVLDLIFAVLISWQLRLRAHTPRPGGPRADLVMIGGVAATAAGVAGFLAIGRPSGGSTHASFATFPPLMIALAVTVGGCLLLAARSPKMRPLATALACGVCYGVAAFSIKLVTSEVGHGPGRLFSDWPIYILLVVGPLGYLLNQDAFQQGTFLAPVQAIITAADPVISIALGIVWLNVLVRSSPAAIGGEVTSILVMIAGIIITAQHSPQVMGQPAKAPAPRESPAGEPRGGALAAGAGAGCGGTRGLRGGRRPGDAVAAGSRADRRLGGPGALGGPGRLGALVRGRRGG